MKITLRTGASGPVWISCHVHLAYDVDCEDIEIHTDEPLCDPMSPNVVYIGVSTSLHRRLRQFHHKLRRTLQGSSSLLQPRRSSIPSTMINYNGAWNELKDRQLISYWHPRHYDEIDISINDKDLPENALVYRPPAVAKEPFSDKALTTVHRNTGFARLSENQRTPSQVQRENQTGRGLRGRKCRRFRLMMRLL